MKTIEVGILGGTGMVGQHFIRFLQGHPWFKLTWLGGERPFGRQEAEGCHVVAAGWRNAGECG